MMQIGAGATTTFNDEWAQLKSEAQDRQPAQMRLNAAAPDPGGSGSGTKADPVVDGQMARLHTTGIAQEFDMSGSSSVKHYDLGTSAPNGDPLPKPDAPGREGGQSEPGREQQEGR
ncbi:hypothetical protein ACFWDI_05995 [Streptomyces sp. NPDC060064]|uniref:hypothetical protein n=1 Tax=Streptomyces sp. NPDC060064 TaxID=3347049 RepID=UPI0036C6985D